VPHRARQSTLSLASPRKRDFKLVHTDMPKSIDVQHLNLADITPGAVLRIQGGGSVGFKLAACEAGGIDISHIQDHCSTISLKAPRNNRHMLFASAGDALITHNLYCSKHATSEEAIAASVEVAENHGLATPSKHMFVIPASPAHAVTVKKVAPLATVHSICHEDQLEYGDIHLTCHGAEADSADQIFSHHMNLYQVTTMANDPLFLMCHHYEDIALNGCHPTFKGDIIFFEPSVSQVTFPPAGMTMQPGVAPGGAEDEAGDKDSTPFECKEKEPTASGDNVLHYSISDNCVIL